MYIVPTVTRGAAYSEVIALCAKISFQNVTQVFVPWTSKRSLLSVTHPSMLLIQIICSDHCDRCQNRRLANFSGADIYVGNKAASNMTLHSGEKVTDGWRDYVSFKRPRVCGVNMTVPIDSLSEALSAWLQGPKRTREVRGAHHRYQST
jgi:hypothetical protein